MSKFAESIKARATYETKPSLIKSLEVKTDYPDGPYGGLATARQVRIGVNIEKTAWIDAWELEQLGGEVLLRAQHDIRRAIIEDVFGEFRPLILEMRAAAYDTDMNKMRELLSKLEHQMFIDGL